jgi:hypothetical protein
MRSEPFQQFNHEFVGPARLAGQMPGDQMLEMEVADTERVGITV